MDKPTSFYNGVNNNYIPPSAPFEDVPEMDVFTVEDTEDGPIVMRKQRESSVDLGTSDAYTLKSMMSNGIDPRSLNIHTGSVARLDSTDDFSKFSAAAERVLDPKNDPELNSNNQPITKSENS
ncbi:hypothetical protein [Dipodfec virus RodF1_17]|uniref:Uncharacterized protein n=1 Tax=Dipodfec virus RodF1_17 TaxID=2929293 RepID=A0A976N2J3_9VIRU|nr:hypothetical protein [Dipodfec virus RodF1_17]